MHGNLIMMLLAALKSHFFAFFSANSLAISSSLIVGERRLWLLYFFAAYIFKDRTDESTSVTVHKT